MIGYPKGIRVKIQEAAGLKLSDVFPGVDSEITLADPTPQHIGKEGILFEDALTKGVVIWLDDGNFVLGSECWWTRC